MFAKNDNGNFHVPQVSPCPLQPLQPVTARACTSTDNDTEDIGVAKPHRAGVESEKDGLLKKGASSELASR